MSHNEEVEDMDTSDTPWFWYFLADCGNWHRFEDDHSFPHSSEDTERYFQEKMFPEVSSNSCRSKIDFSAMIQTDLTTRRQRKVCRGDVKKSCSCFSTSLFFFENADDTRPYQLIPLSQQTHEYQHVKDFVEKEGLLHLQSIVSINRIQNLDLLEFYRRKKIQMMRIQGVTDIEEKRLFHGTEIKNVDLICKYNFDVRLAGQHGHIYGKGVYFAKHASFADTYSHLSKDPLPLCDGKAQATHGEYTKVIFIARVITGKSVVGQSHFQKPDHGSPENTHHSCVNDIDHPTVYIIFDPNQIYPEYVIQYK